MNEEIIKLAGNQIVEPAPTFKEGEKSKELLNGSRVGLHAALLRDGLMPGFGNLDKSQLQEVREKIQNKSFETTKITYGSKHEREDYWKNSEYKDDFKKQKETWVDKTNVFFKNYEGKEEGKILERLNMKVDGAEQVYDEYFGKDKGKGDIGYFAMRVAEELKPGEIEKYSGLLEAVGGFYGKGSSEVARQLAEGVSNVKGENFDGFADSAIEQFNKGLDADGIRILEGVRDRNEKWVKDNGSEPKPEPNPEAPKGESEKGIKDLIEPLFTFDKKIASSYQAEFGLPYVGTEDQKEQIRKSDWGGEIINKYNEDYTAVRGRLTAAFRAKEISYLEQKLDEWKEGDIFDRLIDREGDVLMKFEGKDDSGGYKFRQCGPGKEFEPVKVFTEDEIKEKKFSKIEFASEEKKPAEPISKSESVVESRSVVEPKVEPSKDVPQQLVVKSEEEKDKGVKVEKEIRETMQLLLNFENQMKVASQEHKLDINDPSQRSEILNSEWSKEMMGKYNESYRVMKSKLDEEIKIGLLIHIPSKSGALAVGDIIDLSDKGGPDVLMMFQGKDDRGYNFRQYGPGKELAPNIAFEHIEDQEFQKIGFGGQAQKLEPKPAEPNKEIPQQPTVTTGQEPVFVAEPKKEESKLGEPVTPKESAPLVYGDLVSVLEEDGKVREGFKKIIAIDVEKGTATIGDDKGELQIGFETIPLSKLKKFTPSKSN